MSATTDRMTIAVRSSEYDGPIRRTTVHDDALIWDVRHEWATGVYLHRVWRQRTGRVIVEMHSIWERGDRTTVGSTYHDADEWMIGRLVERLHLDELLDLLPALDVEEATR